MPTDRIGHTLAATVANTNRDGSGTVYLCYTVKNAGGEFIDRIAVESLGTNAATEVVILGSNGQGVANTRNNYILGNVAMLATTLGTALASDRAILTVRAWLPLGHEIYGLVHATQAAGRQFVCYSDSSYQVY